MKRGNKEYNFTVNIIPTESSITKDEALNKISPIIEKIIQDSELKYTSDQINEKYDKIKNKIVEMFGDIDDYFKKQE